MAGPLGIVSLDYNVSKRCINDHSYGVICVKCGKCGRKFNNYGFLVEDIRDDSELRELTKEEQILVRKCIESMSRNEND